MDREEKCIVKFLITVLCIVLLVLTIMNGTELMQERRVHVSAHCKLLGLEYLRNNYDLKLGYCVEPETGIVTTIKLQLNSD